MSSIVEQVIKCPRCKRENKFKVYESINSETDPALREIALKNEAFMYKCECGYSTHMFYPILYHDPRRHFMIQLCATSANDSYRDGFNMAKLNEQFSSYKFRIVDTPYELTEKVLIFESKYDDRVIEVLKEMMLASSPRQDVSIMVFANDTKEGRVFLCLDKDNNLVGMMPFREELYKSVDDMFGPEAKKIDKYIINQEWARDFLCEVKI